MTRFTTLGVVALIMVGAACGGEAAANGVATLEDSVTPADPTGGETGVASAEVDVEEAILAFTECLREQGLDVDDPTFDGEGGFGFDLGQVFRGAPGDENGPNEEFRAALDGCQSLMDGVAQRFARPDPTELEDSLLAFAQCLRAEGLDVADPDLSSFGEGGPPGGGRGGIFGGIDGSDPAAAAALEKCQIELAFGRPGGGPGGGNTGGGG